MDDFYDQSEDGWADMIDYDLQMTDLDGFSINPNARTESLWNLRLREGGFDVQECKRSIPSQNDANRSKVPPIDATNDTESPKRPADPFENHNACLAIALQLLYIASPYTLHALEDQLGRPWILHDQHPAIKKRGRFDAYHVSGHVGDEIIHAWKAIATGSMFRGKFGTYLFYRDEKSKKVSRNDKLQIWSFTVDSKCSDWQQLIGGLMGPQDLKIPGNDLLQSTQTFVNDDGLPPYLTIHLANGVSNSCKPFPSEDLVIWFRSKDESISAARMRWTGGIYARKGANEGKLTTLVFDWGDGESYGMNGSNNWAKEHPFRYPKDDMEKRFCGSDWQPVLMLFRRI